MIIPETLVSFFFVRTKSELSYRNGILPDSGIVRMAMCSRDARHEFRIGDGNRSVAVINENSGSSGSSGGSIFFTKRRCYRALSGVSFQNSVSSGCSSSSSSTGGGGGGGKWSPNSSAPEEPKRIFQHAGSSDEEDEDFYEEDTPELTKVTKNSGTVCVTYIQEVNPEAPESSDDYDVYDRNNSSGSEFVDTAALPEHIYDDVCCSDVETTLPAQRNAIHAAHSDSSGTESEFSGLDLAIFEPEKADRGFIYRPPRPVRNSSESVRKNGDRSLLERGKTFRERLKRPLRKLFVSAPQPPAVDYSGADENASQPPEATQTNDSTPTSVHLPLTQDALPPLADKTHHSAGSVNPESHPHAAQSGRFTSNKLVPCPTLKQSDRHENPVSSADAGGWGSIVALPRCRVATLPRSLSNPIRHSIRHYLFEKRAIKQPKCNLLT